jgi:hypothetical protein
MQLVDSGRNHIYILELEVDHVVDLPCGTIEILYLNSSVFQTRLEGLRIK